MKKFNINDNIYIQITNEGWRHLKKTVGYNYIKNCIDDEYHKIKINGEIWYKLQAHQIFDLLPINFGDKLTYKPNIMFNENDLTKYLVKRGKGNMNKEKSNDLINPLKNGIKRMNIRQIILLTWWYIFNNKKLEILYQQLKMGKTIRSSFGYAKNYK